MITGEIITSLGFKDEAEFHSMVAKVDCRTPQKMNAFKSWQHNDGTKGGLQKLVKLPKPIHWPKSPPNTIQARRSIQEVAAIMGVLGQIGLPPLDIKVNNTKENRTMPIVIKTEKCFFGGKPMHKILKIKAMPQEKLPINYLKGIPHCYSTPSGKLMIVPQLNMSSGDSPITEVVPGVHYTEKELKTILSDIYACGERLQQIRKTSPERWEGKITFVI